MDSKMQIFEHEQFGKLRAVSIDGEPWFVGMDVANALGYTNPRKALNDHVFEEDKQMFLKSRFVTLDIPNRGLIGINESGLYSLILSSKLESAKQFKRWVTSEVLPTIRKYGAYITDEMLEQTMINSDMAANLIRTLAEERKRNKTLAGKLKSAETQLTVAQPKAVYYDALVAAPDCTGIRLTAKVLGVPQSMFTAYLVRKKYAYYDAKGLMHPYALPYRNELFVVREYISANGHRGTQMLITPKGKQLFLAEMNEIAG